MKKIGTHIKGSERALSKPNFETPFNMFTF